MKKFRVYVEIYDEGSKTVEVVADQFHSTILETAKSIHSQIKGYKTYNSRAGCLISGEHSSDFPFGEKINADFDWPRGEGGGLYTEKLPGYYIVTVIE